MASADVENVTSTADKLKLALALVLVLAALGGFYGLGSEGTLVQWAVLLVGLMAAVVVFLVSLQGRQLIGFGRESWREMHKVVWPTRKESMQMTAYVFGFVLLMALFLWLTDKSLEWVLYDLILGWKK
jgi:preprotein translocase subunit SecE